MKLEELRADLEKKCLDFTGYVSKDSYMTINKNNFTTVFNGVLLAIFSYLGISQVNSDLIIQVLAPVISILIAYLMSYFNEKYPSSWVTSVNLDESTDFDEGL